MLVNLLNPKLTIFFFAFLPQFVSADGGVLSMVQLSAVFMLMTFAVFAVYGAVRGGGAAARRLAAAGHGLDATDVRRLVRRARSAAGADVTVSAARMHSDGSAA